MGFWEDIRKDFKADCDRYGKPAIYVMVLSAVCPPLLIFAYALCGEVISGAAGRPLKAVIDIWVVAAESVPPPYRSPCFFASVITILAVGFVTPIACEGVEITRRPRLAATLRVALAVSGAVVAYGAFAVAVLCINPAGPRLWVLGEVVLTFAAVLFAIVRISSAPVFR